MQGEADNLKLSGEQQQVVDLILAGKNVFFTGCAGIPIQPPDCPEKGRRSISCNTVACLDWVAR